MLVELLTIIFFQSLLQQDLKQAPEFFNKVELESCELLNQELLIDKLQFQQKRFIKGMNKPITSSGEMIIRSKGEAKGQELVWETKQPFPDKVVISEQGFEVATSGGGLKSYDSGQFREIAKLILDIHTSKNIIQLSKTFQLECSRDTEGYKVSAKPKRRSLAKYIKDFELVGKNYPTKILLTDNRGDRTELIFNE